MNIRTCSTIAVLMMTVLLSLTGGQAFAAPMTPENAAKRENYRKQKEQLITQPQRKAAADALKAERMKVYKAKQAVKHTKPVKSDN